MQSMQRSFGKLLHKSPGDNARVAALFNDYEDADKLLAKVGRDQFRAGTSLDATNIDNISLPDH